MSIVLRVAAIVAFVVGALEALGWLVDPSSAHGLGLVAWGLALYVLATFTK